MTDPEKKGITDEGQETLDNLRSGILQAAEAEGMSLQEWMRLLCKLGRNAKTKKPQKLKHAAHKLVKNKVYPTEFETAPGVKIKAQTCEEVLVEVSLPDNDTRLSALREIGRATGYSIPDENEGERAPTIIINAPDKDVVKIVPEGEGR